jgi:hypothetical protein
MSGPIPAHSYVPHEPFSVPTQIIRGLDQEWRIPPR